MSPSENLPTLWLLYETREPHLLRNTDDGTPITCIYQSIEHGVKRGTIRIPSQSMDDLGKFEEGSDFCIRFGGPRTPADIARTGYRARLKKLEKNLLFGDLTDEDAQHMGYTYRLTLCSRLKHFGIPSSKKSGSRKRCASRGCSLASWKNCRGWLRKRLKRDGVLN